MKTEFQRGFEACRAAALAVCRQQKDWFDLNLGKTKAQKTATECENEIALLQVPRWKATEEKK